MKNNNIIALNIQNIGANTRIKFNVQGAVTDKRKMGQRPETDTKKFTDCVSVLKELGGHYNPCNDWWLFPAKITYRKTIKLVDESILFGDKVIERTDKVTEPAERAVADGIQAKGWKVITRNI